MVGVFNNLFIVQEFLQTICEYILKLRYAYGKIYTLLSVRRNSLMLRGCKISLFESRW